MFLRSLASVACSILVASASFAQAPASPPATANVTLNGKAVTINYNSPRLKGRTIGSDIVPYGEVWRTGANPATTLITAGNLKIGTLDVPAGTYTLFTLPARTSGSSSSARRPASGVSPTPKAMTSVGHP
jgi:hypothetical protein